MKRQILAVMTLAALITGCCGNRTVGLTPEVLRQNASAWPLGVNGGTIFTDNDAAFLNKVRMIREAKKSIELSYYIFSDDQSSSFLTKALVEAAQRGVAVRLLVDYETNYRRLDLYSMMEHEGKGNLKIRLYNRPTANIVKDAVFMTMGCSKGATAAAATGCSNEKFAAIDKLFAEEQIDGTPVAGRNISNLSIGNSGLFLSGLYAKQADVVALAIQTGEGIDPRQLKNDSSAGSPEQKAQLKKLGRSYWESRTGAPFQRLAANAQLYFAFALYGEQLNPLKETVTSLLPVDRSVGPDEARDWDHFTDYTHHKLILTDSGAIQMGGRNVENSYHMHSNSLVNKYVFMDTDLYARLTQGEAVVRAFDDLWNFTPMVATLSEVRRHAPNDFIVNLEYARMSCSSLRKQPGFEECVSREQQRSVHDLDERIAHHRRAMDENAAIYLNDYLPTVTEHPEANFTLDKSSTLAYLENLPFDKNLPPVKRVRTYGAVSGEEASAGKYINESWIKAIPGVCAAATPASPKRIILHNAYFFPAANLTHALSRMVNGDLDCSNVTVTVLTNSIATTDLSPVNLAAHHSVKAFTEFYEKQSDPKRRARFDYYEYQAPATGHNLSLHSKVSVFGDDIIIGSANADVRSFMMDSNNAMLVRNAPLFAQEYLAFVDRILADPARVKKVNDYFLNTPRETILQEDLGTFRQVMAKYGEDKKLNAETTKDLEGRFIRMLNDAYDLTKASIATDSTPAKRRENQNSFNEEFKPI